MNSKKKDFLIYPEHESKTLEFKIALPDFSKLARTCAAFANGSGGEIIIGVEDTTKKIIGISEKERDKLYDFFPASLYDTVSPVLVPHIYEKSVGDKNLVVIRIWPGERKPYFLKSAGIPRGVYVRLGACTVPANTQTVEDLTRENRRIGFDEEPSAYPDSMLSQQRLKSFYSGVITKQLLLSDRLIVELSGVKQKFGATNGGILMFADAPDRCIPEALLTAIHFSGLSGRNIIQTLDLHGPIPELIDSSLALLSGWLERSPKLIKSKMIGESLIPKEALREAIVNALIHRKYSIPGPVKIALYDDRLEIFSPGGFPGLVTVDSLGDGTTFLRNLVVARIARRMRLIEKLGSGIRLIFDKCRDAGLKKPEFNEDGDFVKVTFYFEHAPKTSELTEEAIVQIVSISMEIRPGEIAAMFKVSRNTVTRHLGELTKKGVLTRTGKGAGVVYRIKQ